MSTYNYNDVIEIEPASYQERFLEYANNWEDDSNKDRVIKGLEYETDDYSDEDDDEVPPDLDSGPMIEEISDNDS